MKNSIIIFIMGVSGSGKTTIGKLLSAKIGFPFFDGDDFHSAVNKDKMRSGQPLTDEDRMDWLMSVNELAKKQVKTGAIIACSALKEKYRMILSSEINIPATWVFLNGSYELILQRIQARVGHYMPASLLASQFEILERPANAIVVDITESQEKIVEMIITSLKNAGSSGL